MVLERPIVIQGCPISAIETPHRHVGVPPKEYGCKASGQMVYPTFIVGIYHFCSWYVPGSTNRSHKISGAED